MAYSAKGGNYIINPGDAIIDMIPMLSGETDIIEINRSFFLEENITSDTKMTEPLKVIGNIVNMSGYMKLSLNVEMKYKALCARCLLPLDEVIVLNFVKTAAVAKSLENEETDEVITEYALIEENKLNLADIAEEQLYLEFPSRHLCSQDCRGLCQKCGHDLNESDCGCSLTEPDPRLEVLRSLLKDTDNKSETQSKTHKTHKTEDEETGNVCTDKLIN
jgi:uncharacterized protein